MRVQVTKDEFGVCMWKANAELERKNKFGDVSNSGDAFGIIGWYVTNYIFESRAKVMPDKSVKRMFPELATQLKDGEHRWADLNVTLS